jgi:aldose 1-epimerase
LFAKDSTSGTESVTRATFAAALQSGLAGTPVQLAFTAGDADQIRPITRSEAAQVLAELLERRALARMTGTAQALVWNSVRPTTPTPTMDVGSSLPRDLQRLAARNIIASADYWLEHAVAGSQCEGAQVAALLARAALVLEPGATAQAPIEILARHGVMGTPAYWIQHARPGQPCGGTTVAALIANLVRQLPKSASPYSVEQRATAHGPEVVLRDNAANTTAVVLPQAGFNCWRMAVGPVEFLAPPADPAALGKGGSGFGWPILFPFPNRVANSEFSFGGKTIRVGPGRGNAIHGFVNTQPWRVTATGTAGGASVTGVTETGSNPLLKQFWPWPCRLTVTYRLAGRALTMTAVAENLGTEPMPFGFGVHPYQPLPLTPTGARARCWIQVPCRERLELTPDCLPTGRRLPATEWLAGRALGDTRLDDVFTGTQTNANGSACVLCDPDSPWEVTVHADAAFPHWVVYAPKRDVVCFEPYTCVTDAFNLHARGVPDTGFAMLEPGKPWRGTVTMQVREQPDGKEKKP